MKDREKLTIKNLIWYTKHSWDYVVTNKWQSKAKFFLGLPRALYRIFIKGV